MRVEQLMSRRVATVRPHTPLKDVAQLLVARGISGVPVCVEDGAIVGVVSETDIVAQAPAARTAGEAMTSPPVVIAPERPLADAARLLTEAGINRLPVVSGGRVVGILTRGDVVAAFARNDVEIARELYHEVLLETLSIPPEVVSVEVESGCVTLRGEVATRGEAELVAVFAGRVPGVVEVDASALAWRDDDVEPRGSAPLG